MWAPAHTCMPSLPPLKNKCLKQIPLNNNLSLFLAPIDRKLQPLSLDSNSHLNHVYNSTTHLGGLLLQSGSLGLARPLIHLSGSFSCRQFPDLPGGLYRELTIVYFL